MQEEPCPKPHTWGSGQDSFEGVPVFEEAQDDGEGADAGYEDGDEDGGGFEEGHQKPPIPRMSRTTAVHPTTENRK